MENKLREYTTSYKYFYNNTHVFVTSAKVGSRFMKSISEHLIIENYNHPFSEKLNEMCFDHFYFPLRADFINYAHETFYKNKEVVFLIRDPNKRFVSGLTTMISILDDRLIYRKEDGKSFMKSYFDSSISENQLEVGIKIFKENLEKFLKNFDEKSIRDILVDNILPESIYKDAHVELHHYMAYRYMNDLNKMGSSVKWIDIEDLDTLLKSREHTEWGYSEKMNPHKFTHQKTPYYKFIKDNLDTWKSQIKELSFYLDLELEYYNKIQKEYEVFL